MSDQPIATADEHMAVLRERAQDLHAGTTRPALCAACGHLLPRDKPLGTWQGQPTHLACQEWAERGT